MHECLHALSQILRQAQGMRQSRRSRGQVREPQELQTGQLLRKLRRAVTARASILSPCTCRVDTSACLLEHRRYHAFAATDGRLLHASLLQFGALQECLDPFAVQVLSG